MLLIAQYKFHSHGWYFICVLASIPVRYTRRDARDIRRFNTFGVEHFRANRLLMTEYFGLSWVNQCTEGTVRWISTTINNWMRYSRRKQNFRFLFSSYSCYQIRFLRNRNYVFFKQDAFSFACHCNINLINLFLSCKRNDLLKSWKECTKDKWNLTQSSIIFRQVRFSTSNLR